MSEIDIVIEKGIPMPSVNRNPANALALIADKMEIGDSVFFREEALMLRFRRAGERLYSGKKFSSRKMADGYRLWRTK